MYSSCHAVHDAKTIKSQLMNMHVKEWMTQECLDDRIHILRFSEHS
jgi:hypothetical protein